MKIMPKENFKKERIKRGFSVVDLAKTVGVTKQAIGQFERRENGISPAVSKRILKAMDAEFDEIFEIVE